MMTVGGRGPCLTGVLLPPFEGVGAAPSPANLSPAWAAGFAFPSWGCWPAIPGAACSAAAMAAALGGSGLFRRSLSVEVDDEGVSTGDWFKSLVEDGDDVPSLPSLFFLALFESLPARSCWSRRRQPEDRVGLNRKNSPFDLRESC